MVNFAAYIQQIAKEIQESDESDDSVSDNSRVIVYFDFGLAHHNFASVFTGPTKVTFSPNQPNDDDGEDGELWFQYG